MSRDGDEPVEIEIEEPAFANTGRAVLVRYQGEEMWIPFSEIDPASDVWKKGDTGKMIIPRWLARNKGIV
jgi:hypothetical protein